MAIFKRKHQNTTKATSYLLLQLTVGKEEVVRQPTEGTASKGGGVAAGAQARVGGKGHQLAELLIVRHGLAGPHLLDRISVKIIFLLLPLRLLQLKELRHLLLAEKVMQRLQAPPPRLGVFFLLVVVVLFLVVVGEVTAVCCRRLPGFPTLLPATPDAALRHQLHSSAVDGAQQFGQQASVGGVSLSQKAQQVATFGEVRQQTAHLLTGGGARGKGEPLAEGEKEIFGKQTQPKDPRDHTISTFSPLGDPPEAAVDAHLHLIIAEPVRLWPRLRFKHHKRRRRRPQPGPATFRQHSWCLHLQAGALEAGGRH